MQKPCSRRPVDRASKSTHSVKQTGQKWQAYEVIKGDSQKFKISPNTSTWAWLDGSPPDLFHYDINSFHNGQLRFLENGNGNTAGVS